MDRDAINELESLLNSKDKNERLESLRNLADTIRSGELHKPDIGCDVNNHIHTIYSFSPYSPTMALWEAYNSGLCTAGIMDHDSVGGVREFTEAGKIIGMPTTIGVECRVDMSHTNMAGRKINNPDQDSIAYMALHGIPHSGIDRVAEFFKPLTAARNKRNRAMAERINSLMGTHGVTIDFDSDVIPLSLSDEGGSVTERHLLFALSKKIIEVIGKGPKVADFLLDILKMGLGSKVTGYLMDAQNSNYEYDLLGALKSDLVGKIYINATDECPCVEDVIALGKEIGAISAYAYLGDVGDSVTGDKKSQKFEDDYLEELFEILKDLDFNAVTYMPSRNSIEQLARVRGLCQRYNFMQISGEDINSPRQLFVCEALRRPEFSNLIETTWALIGHERAATKDLNDAIFSENAILKEPSLAERVKMYAEMGRKGV